MQNKPNNRVRPIPTPEKLAAIALHYLAKYAASEASLRRVLQNRLYRATLQHPDFADDRERQAELETAIEAIIEKHRRLGSLNDALYAETKVRSLRRAGRSARLISQKLVGHGIDKSLIKGAIETVDEDQSPDAAEFAAATALARKRKLGPFRTTDITDAMARRKIEQKEVGTLARAGFSMHVIRRVLGGATLDPDESYGDDWD